MVILIGKLQQKVAMFKFANCKRHNQAGDPDAVSMPVARRTMMAWQPCWSVRKRPLKKVGTGRDPTEATPWNGVLHGFYMVGDSWDISRFISDILNGFTGYSGDIPWRYISWAVTFDLYSLPTSGEPGNEPELRVSSFPTIEYLRPWIPMEHASE